VPVLWYNPGLHYDTARHVVVHLCFVTALYAIARPSVGLSVTRVDQLKTAKVRIVKFSAQFLWRKFLQENAEFLTGPKSGVVKEGRGGENKLVLALNVNVSKTVGVTVQSYC